MVDFFLCHKNWQGVVKIECSPSNCYQVVCMRACIPSWCPCLVWMHIWSIFLFVFSLSLFVHLIFHISSACSVSMVLWHAVQMNMCAGLCVCMCSYIDTHRDTHTQKYQCYIHHCLFNWLLDSYCALPSFRVSVKGLKGIYQDMIQFRARGPCYASQEQATPDTITNNVTCWLTFPRGG